MAFEPTHQGHLVLLIDENRGKSGTITCFGFQLIPNTTERKDKEHVKKKEREKKKSNGVFLIFFVR